MKFFTTTIICLGQFMDKEGYLSFIGGKKNVECGGVCVIHAYGHI